MDDYPGVCSNRPSIKLHPVGVGSINYLAYLIIWQADEI